MYIDTLIVWLFDLLLFARMIVAVRRTMKTTTLAENEDDGLFFFELGVRVSARLASIAFFDFVEIGSATIGTAGHLY